LATAEGLALALAGALGIDTSKMPSDPQILKEIRNTLKEDFAKKDPCP
jgi:hypothetical protein